jgi:sulfatase modifying factor 1
MVEIAMGPGHWCVDTTEVTVRQYAEFLASAPSPTNQPPACITWNISFDRTCGSGGEATDADDPANCVDWCDANAYCKWAGKRLCGKPGGGQVDWSAFGAPNTSEWSWTCTDGGKHPYVYGDLAASGMCVAGAADVAHVMSFPRCVVAAGIFDMNGNVAEWENSCDGNLGGSDSCRRRGGDFGDTADEAQCYDDSQRRRDARETATGFRCCKD